MKKIKCIMLSSLAFITLSACTKDGSAPSGLSTSSENLGSLAVNVNKYTASSIVCDPLNGGVSTQKNYQNGIKADLFYRTSAMPRWYSSNEYITSGFKSTQNIFLSDMNVPTRLFTEGFMNAQGTALQDDQHNKLIEYFGLKMTTNVVLTDLDDEGDYEFAVLSDDGAKMTIKSGTTLTADQLLIDNDGDHPTQMGCATQVVRLVKNALLPIELTYYQGPRYHISNVLMFRKSSVAGRDALCGHNGNNLFFDPDHSSTPQPAFAALLARGWKVLKPENFKISVDGASYNPCVTGSSPGISNFQIGEIILSDVTFSWETSLPATSQVVLTEVTSGVETITTSDNILRLNHQILISGLKARTQYRAQALSVSENLGRSYSSPITFTTQ
jgi:hypothetical protein